MWGGGTRRGELDRSAELFAQICKQQGPYYGLAFLLDSGYEAHDMKEILQRLEKESVNVSR